MRVEVLVPSEEYRNYAGARIRYGRLQPALAALGIELTLRDIETYDPSHTDSEVALVSKCHDARALIAVAGMAQRGRLVGVDLFDDYFSQRSDSRLVRFRTWLEQLSRICHFALCSTPSMVEIVGNYRGDLPCHLLNDPAGSSGPAAIAETLDAKLADARDSGTLRLAWFGVGDNPYFRVGLSDLAAHGTSLASLRDSGLDVELTILTNRRALDADGLERIARLPVRTIVGEWSENAESEVLQSAFACVLPVNFQEFSMAKSLNRAVTALTAGCQVLSLGYPLYEVFDPVIYRRPRDLIDDFEKGSMRLSSQTQDTCRSLLNEFASPEKEARNLALFLRSLRARPANDGPIAVVHGHSTTATTHRLVKDIGGLSVGSPYCTARMAFDVIFKETALHELAMFVSTAAADRLPAPLRQRLSPGEGVGRGRYWFLPEMPDARLPLGRVGSEPPLARQIASYQSTMGKIRTCLTDAFAASEIILSETAQLPFEWR